MVKTCGLISIDIEKKKSEEFLKLANYQKSIHIKQVCIYDIHIYKMRFDLVAMTILEFWSKFLSFKITV